MQVTELILAAAAAASVTPEGSPRRFTVRDVKRELAMLTDTARGNRYAVSEGGKNSASGQKISHELKSYPDLYTTIYNQHERRRIIGFHPVTMCRKSNGGEA